jgi:hypothetical protein
MLLMIEEFATTPSLYVPSFRNSWKVVKGKVARRVAKDEIRAPE